MVLTVLLICFQFLFHAFYYATFIIHYGFRSIFKYKYFILQSNEIMFGLVWKLCTYKLPSTYHVYILMNKYS